MRKRANGGRTEFDVLLIVPSISSEKDVLCLEVAVEHVMFVQMLQPHRDLNGPLHHLPLW
jgi:hypothetical protein